MLIGIPNICASQSAHEGGGGCKILSVMKGVVLNEVTGVEVTCTTGVPAGNEH